MRLDPTAFSKGALQVVAHLQRSGFEAYVVGGAIRDLLLGKQPKDFDIATNATPEEIKQCFRNARIIGRRFQIVHVRAGGEIIEVTTFRGHHDAGQSNKTAQAAQSGRLLRDNVYGTLEEDTFRRDLTINALYYNTTTHQLIDLLNGADDISAQLIRIIGKPVDRYTEDPVRMLRVVRFAARLGFDLEGDTEAAIGEARHLLADIPTARLFDEWLKLFMNGFSEPTFLLLSHFDLLSLLMGDNVSISESKEGAYALQKKALKNTDQRVADGRPVTPAFLLAALYWPAAEHRSAALAAGRRSTHSSHAQCGSADCSGSLPQTHRTETFLASHAGYLGSSAAARAYAAKKSAGPASEQMV
jgi:poly(A) polymerase